MPDLSEAEISNFLEQLGHLLAQNPVLPDFDEQFEVDDGAAGPGIVRVSPDEIEAIVVASLQKIAIEQEEAAHEARLAKQSEVIAAIQDRAAASPALPGNAALLMLDPALVEHTVGQIDAAQAACLELGNAFGAEQGAFQAAADEAETALQARDAAVAEAHKAADAILAKRRETLAALKGEMDAHRKTMAPEAAKIIAEATKKGAAKNLGEGLRQAEAALDTLAQSVETADPAAFDDQAAVAAKTLKSLPGLIRNVNTMATEQRGKDRQSLIGDVAWRGVKPAEGELAMLPKGADAAFLAALERHAKAHTSLTALKTEPDAAVFAKAHQAAKDALDEANGLLLDLQRDLTQEKQARQQSLAALRKRDTELPATTAINGTAEAKKLTAAKAPLNSAFGSLGRLAASGARADFEKAVQKVEQELQNVEAAIALSNTEAKTRADDLTTLLADLMTLGRSRPKPADVTILSLGQAAAAAFNRQATPVYKLIKGLDDASDQKQVAAFRDLVQKSFDYAAMVKRIAASEWGRVGTNNAIEAQRVVAETALDTTGLGVEANREVEALRKLVRNFDEEYRIIASLAADVTDVRTKHPLVLPDQQLILGQYATQTATAALNLLDLNGLKDLTRLYTAAVTAVRDQVQADELANSECGKFVTLFKDKRGTDQPAVRAKLRTLFTNASASVVAGRDAYQCSGESDGEFSIEREIRIDGKAGVLVHAHCDADGIVKPGNGFHIKLSSAKHKTGQGVMLAGPLRATLLAHFDTAGNLSARDNAGVIFS